MKSPKPLSESLPRSIRRHAEANGINKIILTISGGADSVCLLSACMEAGIEILAAHCNFHLRGDESRRDCYFVEALCLGFGIKEVTKDFDVYGYIERHKGISVEMACRELRHEWFRQLKFETSAQRIVTGHNADDNAETLFLNLLRGSGTSGLKGMNADNGVIWRPLLGLYRKDILQYLAEKDLKYVTDSTNLESDYTRNYLRNEIFPLLRKKWPGFDKAVSRTISYISAENRIVMDSISSNLPANGKPLLASEILKYPDPELLVRSFISPLSPRTTTASEILSAIKASKPDIRKWELPGGIVELRAGKLSLNKFFPINV